MNNVLFGREVLKVNSNREAIGFCTPKSVFKGLSTYLKNKKDYMRDKKGNKIRKLMAFDIEFLRNSDNTYNFDEVVEFRLVDWDEWVNLPIRSYDLVVNTPKKQIRIPRVVLTTEYKDMPITKIDTSLKSIYNLYDGICQYTKQKIKLSEASRDHIIPRSKGGKTEHSNLTLATKIINSKKGNKYNHEVGLPNVKPIIPKELPRKRTLKNMKNIPEWRFFLNQ